MSSSVWQTDFYLLELLSIPFIMIVVIPGVQLKYGGDPHALIKGLEFFRILPAQM